MKLALIYYRFLDANGEQYTVGGIQSYMRRLVPVLRASGFEPTVVQVSKEAFRRTLDGTTVVGVPVFERTVRAQRLALAQVAENTVSAAGAFLFASDNCTVPAMNRTSLTIQHGVSWDILSPHSATRDEKLAALARTMRSSWRAIKDFECCRYRVCVDYNFLNWYRAMGRPVNQAATWVIPNSAPAVARNELDLKIMDTRSRGRILFARRFEEYRGTRLMVQVAKQLLAERGDLTVTFAGEGPDEALIRDAFVNEKRVVVTRFDSAIASRVNYEHDIAIVPSLGSEGTSLAVVEAMGAGAVVIASAVGGITNLIADGFNGLLIRPTAESLLAAVRRALDDEQLARAMALNGWATATAAFSDAVWSDRWMEVLSTVRRAGER